MIVAPTKRNLGWSLEREDVLASCALAMPRPSVHKLPPPRQRVRPTVSLFGFVSDDVGKRMLGKLARETRFIARPIADRASKAVRRVTACRRASTAFRTPCRKAEGRVAGREKHSRRSARLSFPRGGPGVISGEAFEAALLELVKRIERAGKDKALVDSVGHTKRGRGLARAATRLPPEVAVAIVIA